MTIKTATRASLLAATALAGVLGMSGPASADSISNIEAQIKALQSQLSHVKADEAVRHAEIVRAQKAAEEAREEAREANARANQIGYAGGQSFTGTQQGGLFARSNGGTFSAQNIPGSGLGAHEVQTAGQQAASGIGSFGKFRLGGVTVTLGGFIAAEMVERSRNDVADIGMTFNSIPYAQSEAYHETEFRGSARQSRVSLLVEGTPSPVSKVSAYYEVDWLSSGTTSNSNESNSYTLRTRQLYATYDNSDWGFHFLGGQAWSLATQFRTGIVPRQENIPLTIDAQYVVGFNWARQWQARFVKDFADHKVWAGISFEEPQVTYSSGNSILTPYSSVNINNAGGSLLNSTNNYSADVAPDIIGKLAFDPGFGHYEIEGVMRFMNDRDYTVPTSLETQLHDHNNITIGGFGGVSALLPLMGKKLVFQAQGMAGEGIGRYASGQLPDATISPNGSVRPIPEVTALFGLVYHPTKAFDLYGYAGTEQEEKTSWNEYSDGKVTAYGYGNGYDNDTGCNLEDSSALATALATCSGQTRGLVEGTLGGWWRFEHGDYGTMEIGAQYGYIRRTAFQGVTENSAGKIDGVTTPKTDENEFLLSFRYLPFL